MVNITPGQLRIVQTVLREVLAPGSKVWVYGSRAKGGVHRASDLDLAIDSGKKLDLAALAKITDAFSEALLPFKADILDLHTTSPEFRAQIDAHKIPLPGFE